MLRVMRGQLECPVKRGHTDARFAILEGGQTVSAAIARLIGRQLHGAPIVTENALWVRASVHSRGDGHQVVTTVVIGCMKKRRRQMPASTRIMAGFEANRAETILCFPRGGLGQVAKPGDFREDALCF